MDPARLLAAFEQSGSRRKFLSHAIGDALSPLSADESVTVEQRVLDAAAERQQANHERMTAEFTALPHLQQAVLWRLLDQGEQFCPYDSAALTFYASALPALGDEERRLKPPQIQKAIDALRNRSASLIWKSIRGEYALDELTMKEWYEALKSSGGWPSPVHQTRMGPPFRGGSLQRSIGWRLIRKRRPVSRIENFQSEMIHKRGLVLTRFD